jgi:hypothetical protein
MESLLVKTGVFYLSIYEGIKMMEKPVRPAHHPTTCRGKRWRFFAWGEDLLVKTGDFDDLLYRRG